MLFEIEIGGRTRTVTVERAGRPDTFRVTLDGEVHEVDAVRPDASTLSLLFRGEGHRSVEAGVRELGGGEVAVYLSTGEVRAIVNGGRSRRAADRVVGAGEQHIAAPMPGKVLRVLVAAGEDVAARQPLVVVEAMKMENELSAARDGRVREVLVEPGVSVEAGRLLVIVE